MSHLGYKHTCRECSAEFLCPWERLHCYNCRPHQPAALRREEVLQSIAARDGRPPAAGQCICGKPIPERPRKGGPRPKYCNFACRQAAYRLRYDGLTAADWRDLHEDERRQNAAMRTGGV